MARANGPAMRVHRKLKTCAAMMWVKTVRHSTDLSSGVNLQRYPAASGIKSENIARGIPSARLSTQDRLPRVASAGTSAAATPIHAYLLLRPGKDPRSFLESAMADLSCGSPRLQTTRCREPAGSFSVCQDRPAERSAS